MKGISKLTAILSLTTGLAAATPAFATDEVTADAAPGMSSIGIDISNAGGTEASVAQFLAGLSPEAQRSAITGCETVAANGSNYELDVQSFCLNVNTLGGNAAAMGFAAPEQRRLLPFSRLLQPTQDPVPDSATAADTDVTE